MLRFEPNDDMSSEDAVRVNDVRFDFIINSPQRRVDVNLIHLCFDMRWLVYRFNSSSTVYRLYNGSYYNVVPG